MDSWRGTIESIPELKAKNFGDLNLAVAFVKELNAWFYYDLEDNASLENGRTIITPSNNLGRWKCIKYNKNNISGMGTIAPDLAPKKAGNLYFQVFHNETPDYTIDFRTLWISAGTNSINDWKPFSGTSILLVNTTNNISDFAADNLEPLYGIVPQYVGQRTVCTKLNRVAPRRQFVATATNLEDLVWQELSDN